MMEIPERSANSSDSVICPLSFEDRTSQNLFRVAAWTKWRLTDPDLSQDLRNILTIEVTEITSLARLTMAMEDMDGETLEDKMQIPEQREILKSLSLRWIRAQQVLMQEVTTALDQRANGNGH